MLRVARGFNRAGLVRAALQDGGGKGEAQVGEDLAGLRREGPGLPDARSLFGGSKCKGRNIK